MAPQDQATLEDGRDDGQKADDLPVSAPRGEGASMKPEGDVAKPSPTPSPQALLYAALARAQGAFPPIPRTRTVTAGSYNFSYAPLDTILDKVRPALAENGLALTQIFHGDNLVTSLLHVGGGVIESTMPVARSDATWQQYGSAITYARRYTLIALLGIASEEDDDGNAASGRDAVTRDKAQGTGESAEDKRNKQLAAVHIIKRKLIDAGLSEEQWQTNLTNDYGTADLAEFKPAQLTKLLGQLREAEKTLAAAK